MALYDEPVKERIVHMLAKRGCKKTACKGKANLQGYSIKDEGYQ